MSKLRKRILGVVITLVVMVLLTVTTLAVLALRTPAWYARPIPPQQAQALESQLIDNFTAFHNQLGRSLLQQKQNGGDDAEPVTIEITQDQLNAAWQKWSMLEGVRGRLDAFVENPMVRLDANRITFAARDKQVGSILQLSFDVRTNAAGRPTVSLGAIRAGLLPVADGLLADVFREAEFQLKAQRPGPVDRFEFDPVNEAATLAVITTQLIDLLQREPVEPVLIVYSSFSRNGRTPEPLAVRVEQLDVGDGVLRATVRPVSRKDQAELDARLRLKLRE